MSRTGDIPQLPPHVPDWAAGAVYQIVVPSYLDTNGDGLGDLPGVIDRLDYLRWLGVDAIWLSPIYPSPMLDMGYDVAEYLDVNPRFGALADFDRLVAEAHHRDIHVLLDVVPNHTSAEHPWFQASRSSREDLRRDWYIWRDGAPGGGPPNNWTNQYEQSDWMFDEATGQYYMHSFMPEMPDLNWWNRDVRTAMWEVLRFWLDRGVDGFRIDAMVHLYKDRRLRDSPPQEDSSYDKWPAWNMLPAFSQDVGGLQPIVHELCQVVREYPGRILIGENHLPPERLALYYNSGLTHPANSSLLDLKWDAVHIQRMIARYEGFLTDDHWPNWVLGSHDNQRVAGNLGPQQARVAAMLHLTLRGTPIVYYGEEIGMHNVDIPPERARDQLAIRMPGKGRGRDGQRTPMQWSSGPHAGFTSGEPWLPAAEDVAQLNVEAQKADPASMLNLYRRLLELRAASKAIRYGHYTPDYADERVLSYVRETDADRLLVALNFTEGAIEFQPKAGSGAAVLSTHLDKPEPHPSGRVRLRPNEGQVISL
ncbi:MAG TPA: alpha-amylase family glycosyl hydrolase [Lacipirellula sp.]